MSTEPAIILVDSQRARSFVTGIYQTVGCPAEIAAVMSDYTVETSLRGVDSHGLRTVASWSEDIRKGKVKADPAFHLTRDGGPTALADADNGPGAAMAVRSMQLAIEKAHQYGIGIVATGHSNTFGAAAYHATLPLEHDMIGLVFTTARGQYMGPWGSITPLIGNNPVGVAVPAGEEFPIVLDFALSTVARGKIVNAAEAGHSTVPEGWALDRETAQPTTDTERALDGLLLPIGGHKGAGMAIAFGAICSVLSGSVFDHEIEGAGTKPRDQSHLFMAIRVANFQDPNEFKARVDERIRQLKAAEPAAGFDRVHYPGERSALTRIRRLQDGIPLAAEVADSLERTAAAIGVKDRLRD